MSTMLDDLPSVLNVKEVSKVLRISLGTVYNGIRTGEIPAFKVGRRYLIAKKALLKKLSGMKN